MRVLAWARRRPSLLLFLVALGLGLLCARWSRPPLVYDAAHYWRLADSFVRDAQGAPSPFAFANYRQDLRGYLFPLFLLGVKRGAAALGVSPSALFGTVGALTFTALLTLLTPALWQAMTGSWPTTSARAALAGVGLFLWRGYVACPLTDLYALTAAVGALVCLSRVRRSGTGPLHAFAVGALATGLLVLRPLYLVATLLLGVALVATTLRPPRPRLLARLALFAGGAVLVAIPQVQINRAHFGTSSPLPQTSRYPGRDLFLQQLSWGIRMQRYETNVSEEFPHNCAVFVDPVGARLLEREGIQAFDSGWEYLAFVLRHPLDVASVYLRHALNGIDLWYPTTYVPDPRRLFWGVLLVNLATWCLTLLRLPGSGPWEAWRRALPYAVILLSPVAASVPMALELRFFWPAHLLANAVAFYAMVPPGGILALVRRRWALVVVFALLWLAHSRATFASLEPC